MNMIAITKALGETLKSHFAQVDAKLSALRDELLNRQAPAGPPGERGPAGQDAPPADPEAVALALAAAPEFVRRVKGEPGKDAAPVSALDVAEVLLASEGFVRAVKGEDGAPGQDAPPVAPEAVALALASVPEFVESVKGAPGADGRDGAAADAAAVADELLASPAFALLVKGEPGDAGRAGDAGRDGVDGRDGRDGIAGRDGLGLETLAWTPDSVHREGAHVTFGHGKVYKALRDTASKPGSADWQRVGSLGFEFKGVKSDEQYEEGDIYVDGGSAFLVTKGRGRLLAGRGKDGRDGDRGPAGEGAPRIVAIKASADSLAFAFDDGAVEEASLEGLGLWSDDTLRAKVAVLAEEHRSELLSEFKRAVAVSHNFESLKKAIAKW